MLGRILLSATAVTMVVPALAQSTSRELPHDRGYDVHTPHHDAVDSQEQPVTQSLNIDANAAASTHTAIVARNQADMESYKAAEAQYEVALGRHAADEVGYARAMDAWRSQAADCAAGITVACTAPTPDPRDYRPVER